MTGKTIAELARQHGLRPDTVRTRLHRGDTLERALRPPERPGRSNNRPGSRHPWSANVQFARKRGAV